MSCGIFAPASGENGSETCGASGDPEKLFSILHSSYRWSDSLEVPNVGALNKMIVDGEGGPEPDAEGAAGEKYRSGC